ncbi:lipid-transfer protein [Striga asiatica]|uniref:Lipid-transfer protein n=1 Tax=Striga asiatica TaxID=4170 RepID=A0A5A7RJS8_STRAF|nr:lipid-transfer protein [Striga asiatica]
MNSKSSSLLHLLTILIIFFPVSIDCDDAKDKQECAQSLAGLATCLPYVGGSARTPTSDCCTGLKQILKTNKKCLCVVVKDGNDPDLSLGINVTLALGLPQACNQPANVSQCPGKCKLETRARLVYISKSLPVKHFFAQLASKFTRGSDFL